MLMIMPDDEALADLAFFDEGAADAESSSSDDAELERASAARADTCNWAAATLFETPRDKADTERPA